MKSLIVTILFTILSACGFSQSADALKQGYLAELKTVGRSFTAWFYPNRSELYKLPEKVFVVKIDSARNVFDGVLKVYIQNDKNAEKDFVFNQQKEIHYFFDRFIIDYPYFHEVFTDKKVKLSAKTEQRLNRNLADFNNPALLGNSDFRNYVDAFLHEKSNAELKKPIYKKMDNQRLNGILTVIRRNFNEPTCRDFWLYQQIYSHLDDWGVKNTEAIVNRFLITCNDTAYTNKIASMYTNAVKLRDGHTVKTYKTVGDFDLDMHLFLPDKPIGKKRPVIVFFSGGSWTKGSPEWSFSTCEAYAKKGWVAASVEYRLADRHGTTPFEAVKDARSAIRWLRQHADEYNIDTNRIIASGNSAGGHLVLAAALANKWNEATDDIRFSPAPNLLLINSGVYDFIGDGTTSWVSKPLKDRNTVKEISPAHLVRPGLPPMLILHGTADQSVPYESARLFEQEMKKAGNDFEFHTLDGAPHEIWFDRRFTGKVTELRNAFLKKYGYE